MVHKFLTKMQLMNKKDNENSKTRLKKAKLRKFLGDEYEFVDKLLTSCCVPNRIEGDDLDLYLLPFDISKRKVPKLADYKNANKNETKNEINDRLFKIKNKMKAPKRNNKSEKALKRREMKKLKKNKEIQKILSSHKTEKNEKIKTKVKKEDFNQEIDMKEIKPMELKSCTDVNKILFSKVDFASHPGAKTKKSKYEKNMKNPKDILNKIKEQDKKINELKESGEEGKARELKSDIIWNKAFDKVKGKKVKDDRNLLYKAIKKKKDTKKRSKKVWKDRKQKVEHDIAKRQQKREENLNKRKKDKKLKKLKKLSKKGHIMPGF